MSIQTCVHRGCGKKFTDPSETCNYHSGTPVFHEGQKGYRCCKPRVLTFDEFLSIPPCTVGKHTTIDDTPAPIKANAAGEDLESKIKAATPNATQLPAIPRQSVPSKAAQPSLSAAPPAEEDDDSDDRETQPKDGTTCTRKGCTAVYKGTESRETEQCVYHPGAPVFHEGSKGYTCCKRRVLEFDDFMRMPGCKTRSRHRFGTKVQPKGQEEIVKEARTDFYQTATTVIASLFLKKINKDKASVNFKDQDQAVELDLHTHDEKHYKETFSLYGPFIGDKSSFKILGTKLELSIAKADGSGWPVLRKDDHHTGEIIQAGRAGRLEKS